MKAIVTFLIFLFVQTGYAQSNLPFFLEGNWKVEGKDSYERWDKFNEQSLKGFSYRVVDQEIIVSEYIDIDQTKKETIYTATVLRQNKGKAIPFKRNKKENTSFVFENPRHDFPKQITYKKLSDTTLEVQLSDLREKKITYRLIKQRPAPKEEKDPSIPNPNYDKSLASKLGGDDYGMKKYVFVLLKTGINTTTDTAFVREHFRGHLENINNLVEQGKLIVAGPIGKNPSQYRGLFILNNIDTTEAKDLLQTDPAIRVGLLETEIFTWYGSAALPEYLPFADKIWRSKP